MRRMGIVALVAGLTLTLGGCAGTADAPDDAEGAAPELTVGHLGIFSDWPLFVAEETGIFDQLGVDVTLQKFDTTSLGFAALRAGDLDMTLGAISPQLMNNVDQTEDQLVLQVAETIPGQNLSLISTTKLEGDLKSQIAALKGKVIGVPALGTDGQLVLKKVLEYAGLDPERDVSYVAVGVGPQMVAAFTDGQIDASMINTPGDAMLLEAGGSLVIDLSRDLVIDGLDPWYGAGYMGVSEILDAKADAVQRFREGIQQANAYINDPQNIDTVAQAVSTETGLSLELLTSILEARHDLFGDDVSCEGIQNVYEFLFSTGQYDGEAPSCDALAWNPDQL